MKKGLNIYWIGAKAVYPVCEAGAVVIAESPKKALQMCLTLSEPQKPRLIGFTNKKKPEVVVINTGEY